MTVSNLMKMAENYLNGQKTLWEKEKLLVTSNFSFSQSVFKRLELQTRNNQGLFGKWLKTLVCRGRGSNPRPPAHEADALTTRPSRRWPMFLPVIDDSHCDGVHRSLTSCAFCFSTMVILESNKWL